MRILGLLALALTAGLSAQAKGAQSPQPKASPSAPTKPVTAPAIKPADSASKPAAPQAAPEKSAKPATAKDDKPPKGGIEHPELVNRIREVLKYGNSQQVRDTLNTLTRLNEAEQRSLLPELKKTCSSTDPLVLRKIAEFIGNVSFHDLDDELAKFLQDKNNDQLFFATVGALAKKKPASALPMITKEIREQDFSKPGNRIPDAVHLLIIYKDHSLQPFLLEKLQAADTYADYRSGILKYLGEATPWPENVKSQVMKLFMDEVEPLTVRGSAAYALGKAQVMDAKPKLKEALQKIEAMKSNDEKKRYTRFRMQVISSLILLKDNEVKEILFAMARDDDEIVRVRAVHQISQLKIPDARELLEYKSKFDPSAKVQREAKKGLSLLDGKKNIPEEPQREQ